MVQESILLKKLDVIQSELEYIKKHLVDSDMLLTDDDIESIKESEKDLKNGKTVRIA